MTEEGCDQSERFYVARDGEHSRDFALPVSLSGKGRHLVEEKLQTAPNQSVDVVTIPSPIRVPQS